MRMVLGDDTIAIGYSAYSTSYHCTHGCIGNLDFNLSSDKDKS